MRASPELSVLLALSLLVGLGALVQNHCRGPGARLLGGGRAGAAGAIPIPPRRSCTRLVINIASVLCVINAIVAFMAPQVPVEVEVPISQAAAAATGSPKVQEQMTTTGAGAAIVLACLAAAALVVNANYLWHLYESGRRRASERPLPLGAPLAAQAYILGFHALPWLGYVVRDQLSMRRADFAVNLGQDAATWGLLALFILVIGLHAAACFAAAAAFAGQARALRCGMERVESPSTALAKLHKLQFRAVVYAVGSFVLYLYIFWAFMIYPYNLLLVTTTTPFHLALVLLLLFCFPPAHQATAGGGATGGVDGMHDLCIFSPATMEMQEAGGGSGGSEGGASAGSAASPGPRSFRNQL